MDNGARQATVHGVAKIRNDLATKPPPGYLRVFTNHNLYARRVGEVLKKVCHTCIRNLERSIANNAHYSKGISFPPRFL